MIISCEKCNKRFEISDELIPDSGRLLQCGSCSYQWHYMPTNKIILSDELTPKSIPKKEIDTSYKKVSKKKSKTKINEKKDLSESDHDRTINNKKVGFFNYVLVIIISLIAIIILLDTFTTFLSSFVPNIDFYLLSLKESLKDIFLFFKDLLK